MTAFRRFPHRNLEQGRLTQLPLAGHSDQQNDVASPLSPIPAARHRWRYTQFRRPRFSPGPMLPLNRRKPMLSEKQLTANHANAQRSTGLRSENGKQRSSLNTRRHNSTGQVTAMAPRGRSRSSRPSASRPIPGVLTAPAPSRTRSLGSALTVRRRHRRPPRNSSRLRRRTFTAEAKSIELLTVYEQRTNRTLQRSLALLQSRAQCRHEGHRQTSSIQ